MERDVSPRLLAPVGWIMLFVGAVSLAVDIVRRRSGLADTLGWPGLVLEIGIDLFLVAAGLLVVLAMRRVAREGGVNGRG